MIDDLARLSFINRDDGQRTACLPPGIGSEEPNRRNGRHGAVAIRSGFIGLSVIEPLFAGLGEAAEIVVERQNLVLQKQSRLKARLLHEHIDLLLFNARDDRRIGDKINERIRIAAEVQIAE